MKEVRQKFKTKVLKYITGGFGLIAALAWRDAITDLIDYFFPSAQEGLVAKVVYAIVMTVVLVLVSIYLGKFLKDKEQEGQEV